MGGGVRGSGELLVDVILSVWQESGYEAKRISKY